MADRDLLHHAATCYRRADHLDEAARCYRGAAMHREAAAVWESLGALAEAAADLADAGRPERAAWLLVHRLGTAEPARALLALPSEALAPGPAPASPSSTSGNDDPPGAQRRQAALLRSLVLARCDVADARGDGGDGSDGGDAPPSALEALDAVMDELARPAPTALEHDLEDWAVELAEAMQRPDLVALLFAAAVRGGWPGAALRWNDWSLRILGVPLVLPAAVQAGGP